MPKRIQRPGSVIALLNKKLEARDRAVHALRAEKHHLQKQLRHEQNWKNRAKAFLKDMIEEVVNER